MPSEQVHRAPAGCAIGVDLGGTNMRVGLVSAHGELLAAKQAKTWDFPEPEAMAARIAELARELAREQGLEPLGIGLGVPNGHHQRGTIEGPPNLPWPGVTPLAALVAVASGLTTALDNDANAAALGELRFGAGRGLENFAVVTLGTGIGSGLIVHGQVVRGCNGFGGEAGHLIVEPDGRLCGCGRQGCVETYASVTGLVRTVIEGARAGRPGGEDFDPELLAKDHSGAGLAVDRAARAGNPLALEAFDLAATMLARALVDLVTLIAPRRVVLFGGLVGAGQRFLDPLNERFRSGLLGIHRGSTELVPSELPGGEAALLGAAELILQGQR